MSFVCLFAGSEWRRQCSLTGISLNNLRTCSRNNRVRAIRTRKHWAFWTGSSRTTPISRCNNPRTIEKTKWTCSYLRLATDEQTQANRKTRRACWRELHRPETQPGAKVIGAGRNSVQRKTEWPEINSRRHWGWNPPQNLCGTWVALLRKENRSVRRLVALESKPRKTRQGLDSPGTRNKRWSGCLRTWTSEKAKIASRISKLENEDRQYSSKQN
jgi:hypothetical protein